MNKKHFEQIAASFKRELTVQRLNGAYEDELNGYRAIASDLCYVFKRENPAFDKDKFMDACGFEAD